MKGDVNLRFIGSKQLLVENIENLLSKHTNGSEETFLDLFAGTNIVGNYFKKDFTVYSNDLLYFSYVNARAIIENNKELSFNGLQHNGIVDPILYLQKNADKMDFTGSHYYEEAYTPTGDSMYLTVENGKRIDYIRETIELWKNKMWITEGEYFYLLSSLIEAIPFVSNITGTYGAYLKHWDKRALKDLELIPLEVKDNKKENKAFNEDANELIKRLDVDIAYIDTPYNNRQYASNYHLLENVARNDKPSLSGKTKIFDWSNLRSDYAMKRKALNAMDDLISNISATHIVLSYNDEGIIPINELTNLMKRYSFKGVIDIEHIDYRKYKSKIPSNRDKLSETLIYIQKKPIKKGKVIAATLKTMDKWKANNNSYIKSPLNYIGGKYKLLKQIIPLFPKNIDTFVDLFSGGANVGINVDAKRYVFNDMNDRINEMFRYFATKKPDELVERIKTRINEYGLSKTNEEAYLKFRSDYNNSPNPLDLYVLVSYSYNYQFRFNNSMEFNNPFGRNRSQFSENMERNLRSFVSKLDNIDATFVDGLFTDLEISNLTENDFVYLDPPYLITTGNYNDGNRGFVNWNEEQENAMYDLLRKLTGQGVRWALSNVIEHKGRSNEYLKSFIKNSNVDVNYLDYNYDNSSHNTVGSGSIEVLVTNYDTNTFQLKNMEYDYYETQIR
ncbi:Dam family site-specific DNA-(adenine-N6)-methyltransferase [Candidatus Woesearchaeota archaeon]|nr:Dam family site-specific DNA-(adenine-N6)-methyltransferase [Candidatus Woesearchaeota archaeon]